MGVLRLNEIGGINLKSSPLVSEGEVLRMVNCDPYHVGSWRKRPGYITYLGTPDNASVSCLFTWQKNNGTEFYNYRISGGTVYHSVQGTGAWTISPNGTMTAGAFTTPGFLEDTMIIGDGTANTRHTTNGTSFTDTTAAPKAQFFAEFQNRIWAAGTASFTFFSNVGTPTDWTNDSSSITIPGAGKMGGAFKGSDRLVLPKNSGLIFEYDGVNLVDRATKLGPSSPQSIGEIEDYRFWLNRDGVWGYSDGNPINLSNKIEKQIYNAANTGIAGTFFDNAPGVGHRFDYLVSVGSISEDVTGEPINNAVLVYEYRFNQWRNYSFANRPTSWVSYTDNSRVKQLVFGDSAGQCYQMSGTATTDNGSPITAYIEGFLHGGSFLEKRWQWIRALFNPGCQASIQVALTNTFTKAAKKWVTLGQAEDGVVEYHFPSDSRGRFLFYKISDSSTTTPFEFFGFELDAEPIQR